MRPASGPVLRDRPQLADAASDAAAFPLSHRERWVVPDQKTITQRLFVFAFLAMWSLYQSAQSGPAFQARFASRVSLFVRSLPLPRALFPRSVTSRRSAPRCAGGCGVRPLRLLRVREAASEEPWVGCGAGVHRPLLGAHPRLHRARVPAHLPADDGAGDHRLHVRLLHALHGDHLLQVSESAWRGREWGGGQRRRRPAAGLTAVRQTAALATSGGGSRRRAGAGRERAFVHGENRSRGLINQREVTLPPAGGRRPSCASQRPKKQRSVGEDWVVVTWA